MFGDLSNLFSGAGTTSTTDKSGGFLGSLFTSDDLPSLSDLLGGMWGGVKDTVSDSDAGEEVKQDAVKEWFSENMYMLTTVLLAVPLVVIAVIKLVGSSSPKKSRGY